MTATTGSIGRPRVVSDALTIAWRNILNIRRTPELLVFSTIQPLMQLDMGKREPFQSGAMASSSA